MQWNGTRSVRQILQREKGAARRAPEGWKPFRDETAGLSQLEVHERETTAWRPASISTSGRVLEAERERVARNLHDELGANLTRIKLLSERMEQDASDPTKALAHARLIRQTCRQLADSMDEIVWAVDPRQDRLENLVSYLVNYATEFLGLAGLRCRLSVPELLPELFLAAQIRHCLFLTAKEALNNVVKHAGATEVRLKLAIHPGSLRLEISDDGAGFDPSPAHAQGNGLANMRTRLAEIGGRCIIHAIPGQGTSVAMTVQLP